MVTIGKYGVAMAEQLWKHDKKKKKNNKKKKKKKKKNCYSDMEDGHDLKHSWWAPFTSKLV